MAEQFKTIAPQHRAFIEKQRVFFVATAAPGSRINLSPKGQDSLRVLDERTVVYLDLTGSGNETAAHLKADGRLTVMFCAFEGPPLILRLYGRGRVLPRGGGEYEALLSTRFGGEEHIGARQMIQLDVEPCRHRAAMRCPTWCSGPSGPASTPGPRRRATKGSSPIARSTTQPASTACPAGFVEPATGGG